MITVVVCGLGGGDERASLSHSITATLLNARPGPGTGTPEARVLPGHPAPCTLWSLVNEIRDPLSEI
eukprot:scaffold8641_cov134-Isochrysis_galbana.AAC.7